MKTPEPYDESDMPWDVKRITINLGGEDDAMLEVEIFCERQFGIRFTSIEHSGTFENFEVEEMHMDVARRLRDFLNYAVPDIRAAR